MLEKEKKEKKEKREKREKIEKMCKDFIKKERLICWEEHFKEGEYCIGEKAV